MVKTVGIICEYNPFHKGHKLQIEHIKRIYDDAKERKKRSFCWFPLRLKADAVQVNGKMANKRLFPVTLSVCGPEAGGDGPVRLLVSGKRISTSQLPSWEDPCLCSAPNC